MIINFVSFDEWIDVTCSLMRVRWSCNMLNILWFQYLCDVNLYSCDFVCFMISLLDKIDEHFKIHVLVCLFNNPWIYILNCWCMSKIVWCLFDSLVFSQVFRINIVRLQYTSQVYVINIRRILNVYYIHHKILVLNYNWLLQ